MPASRKPVIVWTADVPGWAYANRARRLARYLPQYEHRILYPVLSQHLRDELLRCADIVVVQGITGINYWSKSLFLQYQGKIVCRFASVRIGSHDTEYHDVFV